MRKNIFREINEERNRQDAKWGEQNHKPIEWIAILTEKVGEVAKEVVDFHFNDNKEVANCQIHKYREELIQVAAVTVSMIECLDRNINNG